jgi:hypothetical protein
MAPSTPTKLDRCHAFLPGREPLREHATLKLLDSKTFGPFGFLNPTGAQFRHVDAVDEEHGANAPHETDEDFPADDVQLQWSSRNNRKGRHQLEVRPAADPASAKYLTPEPTSSARAIAKNIGRMFTHYPYWDVSWIVAYIFTLGSVVWVFNAFFVWLPLQKPSTEFSGEILYAGGITAFIGATIFVVGSVFLMLEAVNENRAGCFGWAVEQVFESASSNVHKMRITPSKTQCSHHHQNRKNLVGKGSTRPEGKPSADGVDIDQDQASSTNHGFQWYPSWNDLCTYYIHELGFIACSFQLVGATIFWISGFTALPGILNKLSPHLENGIYWSPQVIGGSGFIVSGLLFMLETQKKWYLPALGVLGWHIGLWNLIGGVGFTLCPAFGYDTKSWAQYQASLSTFWGSWAFLIGSLIQLYESLQKYPVEVAKDLGHVAE